MVILSTSKLQKQCSICPIARQEYVCEIGGTDPLIPNLRT